jgi:hypothetical protein
VFADVMVFENGIYDAMVPRAEYALDHDDLIGSLRRDSSSMVAIGRRMLVRETP